MQGELPVLETEEKGGDKESMILLCARGNKRRRNGRRTGERLEIWSRMEREKERERRQVRGMRKMRLVSF